MCWYENVSEIIIETKPGLQRLNLIAIIGKYRCGYDLATLLRSPFGQLFDKPYCTVVKEPLCHMATLSISRWCHCLLLILMEQCRHGRHLSLRNQFGIWILWRSDGVVGARSDHRTQFTLKSDWRPLKVLEKHWNRFLSHRLEWRNYDLKLRSKQKFSSS